MNTLARRRIAMHTMTRSPVAPHVAVLRKPRRFIRQLMLVLLSIPDILDGLGSQTLSQLGQIEALGFDRDPGRIEGPHGQAWL